MMAHESPKEACIERDSIFARLSELCPSLISLFNSTGTSATISSPKIINSTHGKLLCDAIYAFHEPQEQVDVEIVFIHGLEFDGSKEAYWKTWLARNGLQDNCWPKTWLAEKFPYARILSLSYDANVVQTSTTGRMDPYSLGEGLLHQMTLVGIGQHECPVVFVCHSFGGLIAKQIVVTASQHQRDRKVQNFIHNLQAFYFYATPHCGIQVDLAPWNSLAVHGPCMSYLKVFCPEVGRLNSEFEQICREANNEWTCINVGEAHTTSHGRVVVPESSARQAGYRFLTLGASHFDICRPKSKEDSGYLLLIDCISKVIKVHEDKQHHALSLPNGLVGMDDMQNTICEKLGIASIIGLVGMGGIGKTTVSKSVYNLRANFYDKTCFLQDVRSKDLASVQKELFEELCGEMKGTTNHVSQGDLWRIRQCIIGRRVLLVIDDVGDSETLKGLQVSVFQRNLSNGSQVIVTCRNRQVLEDHIGIEKLKDVEIMEVKLLNGTQAWELFQYHAFHGVEDEDDEMKDFQSLAANIAYACCGLPLSLEVIGQHLRKQHGHSIGTRKEIWKEALLKLREAKSFGGGDENEVLWKRLKISYDDLDNDTKSMFLDFACFFCEESSFSLSDKSIGWIWNSPIGLENLLARSLIKIGKIGRSGRSFTIHDQLRDMGRRIVKDLSLKRSHVSLKKMTRLWKKNEIESFLEENQGSEIIEGISLRGCLRFDGLQSQEDLRQEMTIQRFHSLRLLDMKMCGFKDVEFCLKRCWKELSWLCLDEVDGIVMPEAIEAISSCIGLRVLQIRDCSFLEKLPASIGQLVHLLELDLSKCHRLQSLPHEIGHLKQLRKLQLQNCEELEEVPMCINQLINLEYLGLRFCTKLVSMVEFETQMDHLYEIDLSICHRLRTPFKSLGKLHQLRVLDMYGCRDAVIENPHESFGQLSRLKKLNLMHCDNFIPGLCLDGFDSPIGELKLEKAERLWDPIIKSFSFRLQELALPIVSRVGVPTYPKLKVLEIHNLLHLEELPASLGDLTQLEKLFILDVLPGYLKKLPTSLFNLVKLEVFELCSIGALDTLPDKLGNLCLLKTLGIHGMRRMEGLPTTLGELSQLQHLKLLDCGNLKRLPMSSTSLTQLSLLDLRGCNVLEVMDTDQEFILQKLKQHGCFVSPPKLHKGTFEDRFNAFQEMLRAMG